MPKADGLIQTLQKALAEECAQSLAKDKRIEVLEQALAGMVEQFAYTGGGMRSTGDLSALEESFAALGLDDPHPLKLFEICDEPGCRELATCGYQTPSGYRRTCGKHFNADHV